MKELSSPALFRRPQDRRRIFSGPLANPRIDKSESVALTGYPGCGKPPLFNVVAGRIVRMTKGPAANPGATLNVDLPRQRNRQDSRQTAPAVAAHGGCG